MKKDKIKKPDAIALQGALAHFPPRLRELLSKSWAENTMKNYAWGWSVFESWAREQQGKKTLPASPDTVIEFLAHASGAYGVGSISTFVHAIGWAHSVTNFPNPTLDGKVRLVLRGIRREKGVAPKRQVFPITLDHLEKMIAKVDRKTFDGKRDAAVLLLGFHAALRRSELGALEVADIEWIKGGMAVHIRKSKTDQEGVGEVVGVAERGDHLCAVKAVKVWFKAAGVEGLPLRAFCRAYKVAEIVKTYAMAAKLDWQSFSGHSLRAGFITEAFRRGAGEVEIMGTSRHKTATMLETYRREADPIARGASRRMK